LAQANRALHRANADLDTFIYTASHDLRAPVTNLDGLQQLLQRRLAGKLTPTEQQLLDHLGKSVAKLNRVIIDLTQVVAVQKEAGGEWTEVCFSEVLEEVRQDLLPLLTEANAELLLQYEVDRFAYPRKHLRSIVYNLLSNALKYRAPDRRARVQLYTRKAAGRVQLVVADNGLGLEADQREKIFGLFKRMHTHREGSGIGLYMVKRMVENNGGQISVESEIGKGTLIRVSF